MKEETWKDIKGFEGKYIVSNLGRVKSLNYRRTGKERILKARKTKGGYLLVDLYREGKVKGYYVHRLVATTFYENLEGYTEVNHIDENKLNNRADNLEFCSRLYNENYGTGRKRAAEKKSKPVFSVDKESGLIMWWKSANEAGEALGIAPNNITKCCKGKAKSAGGHTFFYAD